jgi:outer membrane protein OmpA-like peptidoglycan-associated protein
MTSFHSTSAAANTASAWNGNGSHSSTSNTLTARRWVRRDTPLPFLRAGLWPLLGLILLTVFALGPLARGRIEKSVRNEVRDTLDEQNHRWAQMSVSGQNVSLSGVPPSISAGDEAMSVARAATCPSWAGPLTCAVQVTGQFDAAMPPPPTPSQPLTPAGESLLPPTLAAAVSAAAPVAAPVAAPACERAMSDVVARSRIEFATARADIADSSAPTLDALAQAAKTCTGLIEVQGHTDSVGQPERNLKLSNARAESVRQALVERGLSRDRLTSRGFGETSPLADNSTPEGRAQNRRIEFRVATP